MFIFSLHNFVCFWTVIKFGYRYSMEINICLQSSMSLKTRISELTKFFFIFDLYSIVINFKYAFSLNTHYFKKYKCSWKKKCLHGFYSLKNMFKKLYIF